MEDAIISEFDDDPTFDDLFSTTQRDRRNPMSKSGIWKVVINYENEALTDAYNFDINNINNVVIPLMFDDQTNGILLKAYMIGKWRIVSLHRTSYKVSKDDVKKIISMLEYNVSGMKDRIKKSKENILYLYLG